MVDISYYKSLPKLPIPFPSTLPPLQSEASALHKNRFLQVGDKRRAKDPLPPDAMNGDNIPSFSRWQAAV